MKAVVDGCLGCLTFTSMLTNICVNGGCRAALVKMFVPIILFFLMKQLTSSHTILITEHGDELPYNITQKNPDARTQVELDLNISSCFFSLQS